jgi:hypothetical protein
MSKLSAAKKSPLIPSASLPYGDAQVANRNRYEGLLILLVVGHQSNQVSVVFNPASANYCCNCDMAQGLLPPDLMRETVMNVFVPEQHRLLLPIRSNRASPLRSVYAT